MNNRRDYLTAQKKKFRASHTTVCLSYPKADANILRQESLEHNLKLHAYLKACIKAQREALFIVPNQTQVQALETHLLRIGNNINQIARRCNQGSIPALQAIEYTFQELQKIDTFITKTFREPWNVETYLTEQIREKPQVLQPILLRVLSVAY